MARDMSRVDSADTDDDAERERGYAAFRQGDYEEARDVFRALVARRSRRRTSSVSSSLSSSAPSSPSSGDKDTAAWRILQQGVGVGWTGISAPPGGSTNPDGERARAAKPTAWAEPFALPFSL